MVTLTGDDNKSANWPQQHGFFGAAVDCQNGQHGTFTCIPWHTCSTSSYCASRWCNVAGRRVPTNGHTILRCRRRTCGQLQVQLRRRAKRSRSTAQPSLHNKVFLGPFMWHYLVENAKNFGFAGPIVGFVGLLLGAGGAITFGWTRTLDTWKPPSDTFPDGLNRIVGMLCAVGLFVVWLLAEPTNNATYLRTAVWLAGGSLTAFLVYVVLWAYCGRFKMPQVDATNRPTREDVIWGGFCLRKRARKQVKEGSTVADILKGNLYERDKVWPPLSLALSAMVAAAVVIAIVVCGTMALTTAGAGIQVALTGKPARSVFSTSGVPGLSESAPTRPTERVSPAPAK